MKTASHFHEWTKTWMGCPCPVNSVPLGEAVANVNSKLKNSSRELTACTRCRFYSLVTKHPAAHRADIRWAQVGPAWWPPEHLSRS